MRLRLFSKPDCHLCEVAKCTIQKVASEFNLEVEEINIENDPEAFQAFRYDIPVVFLDELKLFKHKVDEAKLRKAIRSRGLKPATPNAG